MSNSKAISIRIPDELLSKIDRLAQEKYKSHKGTPNRSLVILDAIATYFATLSDNISQEDKSTTSDSVIDERIEQIEKITLGLADDIKSVRRLLNTLSDTVTEIQVGGFKSKSSVDKSITKESAVTTGDSLGKKSYQLEIVRSDSVDSKVTPSYNVVPDIPDQLSETALAIRLEVSRSTLKSKKKSVLDGKIPKNDFCLWIQKNDPDNFTWEYSVESKKYHLIANFESNIGIDIKTSSSPKVK
jgi:metal-responsive CopG/Arc/MetJ family transcriptional regulator